MQVHLLYNHEENMKMVDGGQVGSMTAGNQKGQMKHEGKVAGFNVKNAQTKQPKGGKFGIVSYYAHAKKNKSKRGKISGSVGNVISSGK